MAIMHVNFQISSIEIKITQLLHLNHPITKSLLTTWIAMTWNMMDIKIRSSDSPLNLGGLVDHVLIKIFCVNYLAWINWKEFDFVNFSNPSKSFILQSYFYFYRSYNFFIFLLIRSHSICFYGCLSFLLCFAFLCFTCWLFFFSFFLFFGSTVCSFFHWNVKILGSFNSFYTKELSFCGTSYVKQLAVLQTLGLHFLQLRPEFIGSWADFSKLYWFWGLFYASLELLLNQALIESQTSLHKAFNLHCIRYLKNIII